MRWLGVVALGFVVSGCAFALSGPSQTIEIETPGVDGVKCTLIDAVDAARHLDASPGQVTMPSGDGPFTISCGKQGFQAASAVFDEHLNPEFFLNILIGGVPGFYIDTFSGAAQKYPGKIVVWLRPIEFASPTEERAWIAKRAAYEKQRMERMK